MMIKTDWKIFSTLLVFAALFSITACNIHYVYSIENDHEDNSSCPCNQSCNTFQHYLENTTKYFSSGVLFYFLKGSHYLYDDVVISNVNNFSMIGCNKLDTAGTQHAEIICGNFTGIVIINSSNVSIVNLKFLSCSLNVTAYTKLPDMQMVWYEEAQMIVTASMLIIDCVSTKIYQTFIQSNADSGLLAIDLSGESLITDLHSTGLELLYTKETSVHTNITVNVIKFHLLNRHMFGMRYSRDYPIKVLSNKQHFSLTINFNSTMFYLQQDKMVGINLGGNSKTTIKFDGCKFYGGQFLQVSYVTSIVSIQFPLEEIIGPGFGAVWFTSCAFSNNYVKNLGVILRVVSFVSASRSEVHVTNCTFNNNYNFIAMECTPGYATRYYRIQFASLYIENTSFHSLHCCMSILSLSQVTTYIQGSVIFTNIIRNITSPITWLKCRSIIECSTGEISIQGYMEISNIKIPGTIFNLKRTDYLTVYENTVIKITGNTIGGYIFRVQNYDYPNCLFQYKAKQNNYDPSKLNYSITINGVFDPSTMPVNIVHCTWLDDSVFNTTIPSIVNSKIIQITNVEGQQMMLHEIKKLCYCTNNTHYDCSIDELGPIFPGQMLSIKLAYNLPAYLIKEVYQQSISTQYFPISVQSRNSSVHECGVLQSRETIQKIEIKQCNTVHFTILSNSNNVCELLLFTIHNRFTSLFAQNGYFVRLHACPVGFILHEKRCRCDLVLTNSPLSIQSCDIDRQAILRPANSWIVGDSVDSTNNSHRYLVSAQCPFDYCIPHSSYLNLSSPHLQCQFNRTGLLCGKCHPSLSAVFGSSQCQQCSNVYLLIVVPLAITGVLLVFLMFFLNLTITDGDIIPFIFYSNIVSINSAIFFPQNASNHPAYVFISLANLDLGINMCFYDGMDDYVKMWLTAIFPLYIILFTLLLSKISHYSTKLQWITACRSTHVMATVFLLSYTKLLIAASRGIFFYTKIIHLPNQHSTVAWSVDANLQLFGVKFSCLFVTYLVIFLIIIAFTAITLIRKSTLPLNIARYVTPLLVAFQTPYKEKYYYWPGLQLLLRALFFALSVTDKKINLITGIIILATIGYIHGQLVIFKSDFINYNEILYLLNLVVLFSFHTQNIQANVVTVLIGLAALQFSITILYHIIIFGFHGKIKVTLQNFWQTFSTERKLKLRKAKM